MGFLNFDFRYGNSGHSSEEADSFAPVIDSKYGIYSESHFNDMLALERKRTERSKRPFILMLMDLSALPKGSNGSDPITKAASSLAFSTRETDVRGWYRHNDILGVIFTELGDLENANAPERIHDRVYMGLLRNLGPEKVEKVRLSLHAFPEESGGGNSGCLSDLNLYPDLNKAQTGRKIPFGIKRALDILGSMVALILFSPLFLLISIAIKFTSKGPIFYRQERIGQFSKKFLLFKFRSMYVDNDSAIHKEYVTKLIKNVSTAEKEECGSPSDGIYKIKNDPRVTAIGRLIRKTSLDEVPQFLNVLFGDMSLVGPRPPVQYEIDCYDIWHRRRILEMKPGITGIWQVYGRSKTTFDQMVRMDLRYTREWSLWLDIVLILKTPWVVLTGSGGY